jgi:hypothetical protein
VVGTAVLKETILYACLDVLAKPLEANFWNMFSFGTASGPVNIEKPELVHGPRKRLYLAV